MKLETNIKCLRILAPELAQNPEFVRWMNSDGNNAATWHTRPGTVCNGSDVFVWIANGGAEGSDTDMPPEVWQEICNIVGPFFEGLVWLSFEGAMSFEGAKVVPPHLMQGFDSQNYLYCLDCKGFVNESEAEAHFNSCGRRIT